MSKKDTLHVEEVDELAFPEGDYAAQRLPPQAAYVPVALPSEIYSTYGQRRFRLLREAKDRVRGVLLEMDAWNVLWQIDSRRTVAEIAENLLIPLDVAIYHVECLKLMGIVCPVDAIYLPEFILDKTEKKQTDRRRRRSDAVTARGRK